MSELNSSTPLTSTSPSPHLIQNNQKNEETHLLAIYSSVTFTYPDINEISADQGRRREEKGNSLRPEGRPNPIIPITPLNHTLMMGIKMCWPQSTPTRQLSAAECVWSRAVAAGKDECEGVCYLCASAQQYGRVRVGTVRWKGCSRTLRSHLHCVLFFFLLQPAAHFGANSGAVETERKSPRLPQSCSAIKKEQFNPLKLTPLLPSLSPFPHKHTDIVQMYPNRRGIQKRRVVFLKKRGKKVSIIFLSCRVRFFSPYRNLVFLWVLLTVCRKSPTLSYRYIQ